MENLEPIKVIGEGAFGKVYLMRHKVERLLLCVKVIKVRAFPFFFISRPAWKQSATPL